MNDVSVWINYRMHKCGDDAENGIRVRMTRENYERLKAGKTVYPINALCQALAMLTGYDAGHYLSFDAPDEIPDSVGYSDDVGYPDCEDCRVSGLLED